MPVGTITIESGDYKAHIVVDNEKVTAGVEFRGKLDTKSPEFLFVYNCKKMILDRLKEI